MVEHLERLEHVDIAKFRRICMVSSAVFSTVSVAYELAAPLGAALGLVAGLAEDHPAYKVDTREELKRAVESALKRTQETITSSSKIAILDELSQEEIEPDSLEDLILRTEAYQTQYCTKADVKEILAVFDMCFRNEIAQRPHLSNLYVLSAGMVTLEKLKSMNEILIGNDKKLGKLQNMVADISKGQLAAQRLVSACINSLALIIVAMGVFLGMGMFLSHKYDREMLVIAPACYGISAFLTYFFTKKVRIPFSRRVETVRIYATIQWSQKILVAFIVPLFLTLSCFWIIVFAVDLKNIDLPFLTLALIVGNITSLVLKEMQFERRNKKPQAEQSAFSQENF